MTKKRRSAREVYGNSVPITDVSLQSLSLGNLSNISKRALLRYGWLNIGCRGFERVRHIAPTRSWDPGYLSKYCPWGFFMFYVFYFMFVEYLVNIFLRLSVSYLNLLAQALLSCISEVLISGNHRKFYITDTSYFPVAFLTS